MSARLAVVALLATAVLSAGCASRQADLARDPEPTASSVAATPLPVSSPNTSSSQSAADGPWRAAGTSVQGRPIRIQTLGQGPRRVLFIGGIHGDEAEGSYVTAELPAAFTSAGLADRVTLTVLEDANPDGRAAKTRGNANGVDINRNFPASNFDPATPDNGGTPLNQPESRTIYTVIEDIKPELIVVMHSWQDKQFINFDGPARDIAERFAAASGLPLTASNEFAPTPGSLGSYAGRDGKHPVLTIEFRKGSDPKADWNQIRDALISAIAG